MVFFYVNQKSADCFIFLLDHRIKRTDAKFIGIFKKMQRKINFVSIC